MIAAIDLTTMVPNPSDYVGAQWGPIFNEILTKFVPFAGAFLVGGIAIKRLSAGR